MKIYNYGQKSRLTTNEKSAAKNFNDYFPSIIKHLYVVKNKLDSKNLKFSNNHVLLVVNKFQNHPSILKIKSNRNLPRFHFSSSKL